MANSKMKLVLFRSLFVLLLVIVSVALAETAVYMFSLTGKVRLVSKRDLATAARNMPGKVEELKPVYIPHPYFGYVYTPNNGFAEGNYVGNNDLMEANSDGFIEKELPDEKRKGECIYGLLGGSAAMSWGCATREYRLSYQLEKLLNAQLVTDTCRRYRVLNMGIGSHIQYQATQIFLYYASLFDGVIFYNGFNECAHGAMLTNSEPIEFPVINLYASLTVSSPLTLKMIETRQELGRLANFMLRHSYLSHSPLLRLMFRVKSRKLERYQAELQAQSHQSTLPGIKGRFKEELRNLFPKVTPESLMHSYDRDDPVVPKVLEKILPFVYTQPTLQAYAVARKKNIHFLSVIQPMIYVTGNGADWKERRIATHHFQKSCVDRLSTEARKLEGQGIATHNINEKNLLNKELFWSQVHIKPAGNEIVARYLFELIKREWHEKDDRDSRKRY